MKKLLTIIIAGTVVSTGCTMAPKYARTKAPVSEKMPQGQAYEHFKGKTEVVSDVKWQDFFQDEKLRKVIKMGLMNNRDLRVASLTVEKTMAAYNIQRSQILPTASVTGAISKQHVPADLSYYGTSYTSREYSLGAGISWELDFFGRIRSLSRQAQEQFFATEEAQRSAQISLISSIADAYLALAADRGILNLAESTLDSRRDSFKMTQRRYKVELATELDLKQAQSQVHAAESTVAQYTQLVAQDVNALNLLVGRTVPDDMLPGDLSDVKPFRPITPDLSSEVLLSRPDVMQAEHSLKAAYAYIGAARAACFPSISLTTSGGLATSDLKHLFRGQQGTWSFAPQINLPIFNPSVWIQLKVSKIERKIALAQYEEAIQSAFREVADTLAAHGMMDKRLSSQESYVQDIVDTYNLSNQRYLKGIDSYLTVLDSQRTMLAAQQSLISLRLARLTNQVKLYSVLGGGWIGPKKKPAKKTKKAVTKKTAVKPEKKAK